MKIGFTGTRFDVTPLQREKLTEVLQELKKTHKEFHHGGCYGADVTARDIAISLKIPTICHPGSAWQYQNSKGIDSVTLGILPYIERDIIIVEATDILVAVSRLMKEEKRSGTWTTVREAKKRDRPVIICWPDGSITKERT